MGDEDEDDLLGVVWMADEKAFPSPTARNSRR